MSSTPTDLSAVPSRRYNGCMGCWIGATPRCVDADLSSYFDTIPHHELMRCVARRVSDGPMLALIKTWLEMAVEEDDGSGHKRRTTENKDGGRGTPQGSPLSP